MLNVYRRKSGGLYKALKTAYFPSTDYTCNKSTKVVYLQSNFKPEITGRMSSNGNVHSDVKDYYGQQLQATGDLKTSACTIRSSKAEQKKIAEIQKLLHEKVTEKYYGCGLVAPVALDKQRVLDLGCGSGVDCYVLAKLVGPEGYVTGVDMTEEQLKVAREYVDYHRQVFGYEKANTEFLTGYIEDLKAAGIKDETQNLVVSNCVVNLAPDKRPVIKEAFRVLQPGGEVYFSDVYCDKVITDDLRKHKVLWGECISGALHWEELHTLAAEAGFCTPILYESSEMVVDSPELKELTGHLRFVSATYRLFKVDELEKGGSVSVTYKGGIPAQEDSLKFAHNITFKKGCALVVPGEVASVLMQSRFSPYFDIGQKKNVESQIPLMLNPFEPGVSTVSSGGCCASSTKCC